MPTPATFDEADKTIAKQGFYRHGNLSAAKSD
jgi:hypothetical protein